VLLRRDRPAWPRPYRLRNVWIPVAIGLFIFNLVIAVVGIASPTLTGYGNSTDTVIALALLFVCIPLFLVRKLGQDRQWPFRWREETAATPPAVTQAVAAGE
jgi:membrane protease YdiL (CAAX protease family)